jgi:hypothetical protein
MPWITDATLRPTGARWSCAAYWGTADWEDAGDWPIAYDASAALRLGVYVGGHDVTEHVRSLGWGLGGTEALGGALSPGSVSADFGDLLGELMTAGDRFAVLTEWDVLWVGQVEEVRAVYTVESTSTTVSAIDDLARAAQATVTGKAWGGAIMGVLDTMLVAAGMVGRAWAEDPDDHDAPAYGFVLTEEPRDGTILQMISDAIYHTVMLGAWTPQGLRVCPTWLEDLTGYAERVASSADLAEYSVGESVQDVHNAWTVGGWGFAPEPVSYADADSQGVYGLRPVEVDGTGWVPASTGVTAYWYRVINGGPIGSPGTYRDWYTPVPMLEASANIARRRHELTRLLPFDRATIGGTTYRILGVQHQLTPDAWSVSLTGVATGGAVATVLFDGDTVVFDGDTVVFTA